ncbi:MAG TPA: flagellar basal body P-ring formation chaperone FlgA, partial [Acetobacteraceae bacterium]|nr:flagellar basal body P-ring formation chaperone FlgA [Acetobacteraceae bacterium]
QLQYEAESGRFTAILSVTGAAMEPVNLRLAGRAEATEQLPVATARLPAGTVLRAEDLRLARIRVSRLHGAVVRTMQDAAGLQLRRPALPGQPLQRADLVRPSLVQRGATVRLELQAGGLRLTAQGIAMQSGAAGERIRVMNTASRALLEAVVSGPDAVRVLPGTAPLPRVAIGYAVMAR